MTFFVLCVCRKGMLKPYPCFSDTVPTQLCVTNEGEQVSSNMIKPASYLTSPPLTTPPLSSPLPPLSSPALDVARNARDSKAAVEVLEEAMTTWKQVWLRSGSQSGRSTFQSGRLALHSWDGSLSDQMTLNSLLCLKMFVSWKSSIYTWYLALVPCM